MKKIAVIAAALFAASAWAQVFVQPYVRSDGTFVPGYVRTAPDASLLNNYSTQGNVNPYTGQAGTVNPYQQQPAYPQLQQPQINQGSMYNPYSGGMYLPQPQRR